MRAQLNRRQPTNVSTGVMYTFAERTQRKYTVADAIQAALVRLSVDGIQLALVKTDESRAITLVELNELADDYVTESRYYARGWKYN